MLSKSFLNRCNASGINSDSVVSVRLKYLLIHHYLESDSYSILAFSDDKNELADIASSNRHFGSNRHVFTVCLNDNCTPIYDNDSCVTVGKVKDIALLNLCKNCAQYLDVAEYAMLKKSYDKSLAWFDRANTCNMLGNFILENY